MNTWKYQAHLSWYAKTKTDIRLHFPIHITYAQNYATKHREGLQQIHYDANDTREICLTLGKQLDFNYLHRFSQNTIMICFSIHCKGQKLCLM